MEEEILSSEDKLQSKIVRDQPAEKDPTLNVDRVLVHEFSLRTRIPTKQIPTSYLVHRILGNDKDSLLVSPTGGVAEYKYYKPMAELQSDTERGGSFYGRTGDTYKYKHTSEDSLRFWLASSPDFIKELTQNGWMFFPAVEHLPDENAKKLDVSFNHEVYRRKFKLSDLIRVIEQASEPEKFNVTLNDFKELAKYGNDIDFVYRAGGGSSSTFFVFPVTHKGSSWRLKLEELSETQLDSVVSYYKHHNEPNTLQREVSFGVGYNTPENAWDFYGKEPDWWTTDHTLRIRELTVDYVKANGLDERVRYSMEDPNHVQVSLSNRRGYTQDLNPDTSKLLTEAEQLKAILRTAIKNEHSYHIKEQAKLLKVQKTKLGL